MFSAIIHLPSSRFGGCEALDFCRSKGLPDKSPIGIESSSADTAVDEAFARAYFPTSSNSDSESIELDMLVPGDLETTNGRARLNQDMAPERIRDLYLAGRMVRLTADSE
jgi:hypothetical protein